MAIVSIVKLLHLCGLIMGFGGAVFADLTILRHAVLRPVRRSMLMRLRFMSRIIMGGLAILWVTGIALIMIRQQTDPAFLGNPKLQAKIAIVAILTVNGLAIHLFALPALARCYGRRLFDRANQAHIAALSLIAAISISSWIMPFVLGSSNELNYTTPSSVLMSAYAAMVFSVWLVMFVGIQALARHLAGRIDERSCRRALRLTMPVADIPLAEPLEVPIMPEPMPVIEMLPEPAGPPPSVHPWRLENGNLSLVSDNTIPNAFDPQGTYPAQAAAARRTIGQRKLMAVTG